VSRRTKKNGYVIILQFNADKTETLVISPYVSVPGIKQYLGDLGQSAKTCH